MHLLSFPYPFHRGLFAAVLALVVTLWAPATVRAEETRYAKLSFGDDISIEVPRNWLFLDEKLREQIKKSADKMFRVAGLDYKTGGNKILVAANGPISKTENGATMRLSVEPKKALSQEEVAKLADADIAAHGTEVKEALEKATKDASDPQKVEIIATRREKLGKYQAIVVEYFRVSTVSGKKQFVQINIVNLGDRSVKLTMSYRESHAETYRPITQAIRSSLVIQ